MAFCKNCGNQMPEGIKFCSVCGAAQNTNAESQQPAQPQVAPQQPHQQPPQYQQPYVPPAPPYMEEPISTGGYIGIFLLLMIPLVNLICLIIWACGGCNKKNKTNLSRALLVWMLIGTIIGGIIVLAGGMLFGDIFNELGELGSELNGLSGGN